MTRKKSTKIKTRLIKPLAWIALLFVALVIAQSSLTNVSADSTSPLRTSRINIQVQNPNNEGIVTEFPDGRSFIEVNVNVYKRDGSPLMNEPLIVDKSSAITMVGPNTTGEGNIVLKFAASRSVTDRIRIKLKNCMTVKADFRVRFASDNSIKDLTDKNSFVQGAPLTLQVQVKPWMTDHLKAVQARYTYTRRVNKWGLWFNTRRVAGEQMSCNDGICQATFGTDFTSRERNSSGNFTYQFVIVDQNGKTTYSRAYKAKLKNP